MKTILVINSHSIVDVITNSSSELFVCDKDKSIEFVKKILKNYKVISFSDIYLYTQEMYDKNIDDTKKSCIEFIKYYNNYTGDDFKGLVKDTIFENRKILEKMRYNKFDYGENDYRKKSNIDKIIIKGLYINSISNNLDNDKFNEMISVLNAKIYK